MRTKILSFLLIVVFALLQATFFSFNLVLLAVLSLSVLLPAKSGLIWAFFGGVVLDLVTGGILGVSSLIFLAIAFTLNLYKTKFKASHFVYLLPFTFFSACFYIILMREPFYFTNVLGTIFFLFLIWPLFLFWIVPKSDYNLQLPLNL